MPWFAAGRSPYETARAMVGAKAGDRVLVLGAIDAGLVADIALVTGLNGQTLVADPAPDMQTRIDKAAARAGALVETVASPVSAVPVEAGHFDIVVIQGGLALGEAVAATLAEAGRVARPGGRVLAIERSRQAGLMGLGRGGDSTIAGADICRRMTDAGLRAARVLGEPAGHTYVEAIKPRA